MSASQGSSFGLNHLKWHYSALALGRVSLKRNKHWLKVFTATKRTWACNTTGAHYTALHCTTLQLQWSVQPSPAALVHSAVPPSGLKRSQARYSTICQNLPSSWGHWNFSFATNSGWWDAWDFTKTAQTKIEHKHFQGWIKKKRTKPPCCPAWLPGKAKTNLFLEAPVSQLKPQPCVLQSELVWCADHH